MKLIVGLGNPGQEYQGSRHNVGFDMVDLLARRWMIEMTRQRYHGFFGGGIRNDASVMLLKPQTYMNRSGASVAEAVSFYKLPQEAIMVVLDDMALPVGRLRLRRGGSAGGHNGLQDIVDCLGSDAFSRLRVGIGAAAHDAVNHVLGAFDKAERPAIEAALTRGAEAVECWLDEGIEPAMNLYNVRNENSEKE